MYGAGLLEPAAQYPTCCQLFWMSLYLSHKLMDHSQHSKELLTVHRACNMVIVPSRVHDRSSEVHCMTGSQLATKQPCRTAKHMCTCLKLHEHNRSIALLIQDLSSSQQRDMINRTGT